MVDIDFLKPNCSGHKVVIKLNQDVPLKNLTQDRGKYYGVVVLRGSRMFVWFENAISQVNWQIRVTHKGCKEWR